MVFRVALLLENLTQGIKMVRYKCSVHLVWMILATVNGWDFFMCPINGCEKKKANKSGERVSKKNVSLVK